MKIPNKVRIGGVDYEIKTESNVRIGNDLAFGKIDYGDCIITLSDTDGKNHQHRCITLWHEILHGITEHACLDLPQDDEEKIIDTLAKGIYQVLQDNGAALFDLAVEDSK